MKGQRHETKRFRRWLALAVVLVGTFFVGKRLERAWPRSVDLQFEVGQGAEALAVDFVQGGQAVKSVRFDLGFDPGPVVAHRVELVHGNYELVTTLYRDGLATPSTRSLSVPTQGVAVIDVTRPAP